MRLRVKTGFRKRANLRPPLGDRNYFDEARWNREGRHRRRDFARTWFADPFCGDGEQIDDLVPFDAETYVDSSLTETVNEHDIRFLQHALTLARKGIGLASRIRWWLRDCA